MTQDERIEKILASEKTDKTVEYIREYVVRGTYILYNSKKKKAVCTRCGQEWDIAEGEYSHCHDQYEICPYCGDEAVLKSAGLGRQNITETFRFLHMFRRRNTAYAIETLCRAEFSEFGKPEIYASNSEFFSFNAKEQHKYKREYDWNLNRHEWKEAKNIKVTTPAGAMYNYSKYYDIYLNEFELEEVFTKSDLKYLWDEKFIQEVLDLKHSYGRPERLIRYISQGMKYQSVEMLVKSGFTRLAAERAGEYPTGSVYWRGKTLPKILRLNMGDIRRIREYNPCCGELAIYQSLSNKERLQLTWPMVKDMAANGYRLEKYRKEIEEYTSLIKLSAYLQEQINKYKLSGVSNARRDWLDYMNAAKKLGLDIRRRSVIFPDNLIAAHDEAIEKLDAKENQELSEKIKKNAIQVEYKSSTLKILIADSQQLLNKESSVLGHCVKTYGQKLADGRCYIFFVRRIDEEATPYYTLETDPKGNLVQCRGSHNCGMTEEVQVFVDGFIKHLKKQLKKEETKCQKAA